MTGQERADQIRKALTVGITADGRRVIREGWHLLPPGSVVLTPEEVEKVQTRLPQLHPDNAECHCADCEWKREALALLGGSR